MILLLSTNSEMFLPFKIIIFFFLSIGSTGSYKLQNTQQHVLNPARRTLLEESHNLPAAHIPGALPKELGTVPSFGSGSFPAIRNSSAPASLPSEGHLISPSPPTPASSNAMPATSDTRTWNYIYVLPAGAFLSLALVMLCVCRRRTNATIVPLESGSSGQLEPAFVTGDFTFRVRFLMFCENIVCK